MSRLHTRSGSVYQITGYTKAGLPLVQKVGWPQPHKAVALFPDRLPCFEATVAWKRAADGRLEGFNKDGVRTLLFVPNQIRVGMILASPNGLRSTPIVKVE